MGAYENFLADYTEVDPNSKITLTSTRTSWANITDGVDAYVYCDKGADHFSGAYKHLLEITLTSEIPNPWHAFWALTNELDNLQDIDDANGYEEYLYYDGSNLKLVRVNAGVKEIDSWTDFVLDTVYYVTIERTAGGVLTAEIRTGSHTGTLQDTLQVTAATTAYRYIHSFNHFTTISGNYFDGWTQNLDLESDVQLLAGIVEISSTVVAGTIKRIRELAGTTVCAAAVTGNIKAIRGVSCTTLCRSWVTGELSKTQVKELSGTIAISSTVTGEISCEVALVGIIVIESACVASMKRTRGIAGNVVIGSWVTGELVCIKNLAGVVTIVTTVTGELIKVTIKELAGTVVIGSVVTGEIASINYLAGTIAVSSAVTGQIKVVYKLAGTVAIQCTVVGELHAPGEKLLAGVVHIKSVVTGILIVYYGYQLLPPFMQKDVIDPYSGGAWLWLAEIVVPTQTTQRIARNTADVHYDGEDFIKNNFKVGKQSLSGDGSVSRVTLRVAQDRDHTLESIVNATKGGENGTIKIIRTCEKYLEQPAAALQANYDILTAGSDFQGVIFVIGMPNLLTQRIPLWLYSSKVCPLATPSLFKGPRCQYAGEDTTCTGLLEDCYTKGNAAHWGAEIGLDPNAVRV